MFTLVGWAAAAVPAGAVLDATVEEAILALELRVTTTMLEVDPARELNEPLEE